MARLKFSWFAVLVMVVGGVLVCAAETKSNRSVTVIFKDGHQKSYSVTDLSRIEFNKNMMLVNSGGRQENIRVSDIVRMEFQDAGSQPRFGRNHFVGKWEFGEGYANRTFLVTLYADGKAYKSLGASHGTWVVVDNEARISWDDGWKDVIRKVGNRHEKLAYEPGRSINDEPSNVAEAKTLNSEPI